MECGWQLDLGKLFPGLRRGAFLDRHLREFDASPCRGYAVMRFCRGLNRVLQFFLRIAILSRGQIQIGQIECRFNLGSRPGLRHALESCRASSKRPSAR